MTNLFNDEPAGVAVASPLTTCGSGGGNLTGKPLLATRPHTSNRYHFGMLLGVDDLETDQAYHRGKHWLHQAWLHGPGVIWGFGVGPHGTGEVRVGPGLGLDCRGRELCLDQGMCLDLGAWYDAHRGDIDVQGDPDSAPVFRAHVTVAFRACLDRQVPALRDVCGDPDTTTAYSRVIETVDLELVAGPAPDAPDPAYPRLRAVFGQGEPPEGWEPSGAGADLVQSALVADSLDLVDEDSIVANERIIGERPVFPCDADESAIVLAELEVELRRQGAQWEVDRLEIDNDVRTVLLDTSTIQSLLTSGVAAGPQLVSTSMTVADTSLTVSSTQPLLEDTIGPDTLVVSALGAGGWTTFALDDDPTLTGGTELTVDVDTGGASLSDFDVVRFIARGTGPTPIVGTDLQPLAGATGQGLPAGTLGADAVLEHRS